MPHLKGTEKSNNRMKISAVQLRQHCGTKLLHDITHDLGCEISRVFHRRVL